MAIYLRKFRGWVFLAFVTLLIIPACENGKETTEVGGPYEGKIVYQRYCVSCHGEKGNSRIGNAADLSNSDISTDSIRRVILYGNSKGMGPYKTIIKNDTTLNALVEYVKTLRTD